MQPPQIIHTPESEEYYFEEGCYILELSNSEVDPALSIARARVKPNRETQLHKLISTVERYIILAGQGQVTLGDEAAKAVAKNDVVIIPEACPQKILNVGSEDLVFLVICSPRFLPDNYQEI